MKYTDVAWDFDGTLFDTYPNLIRAFRRVLESYGCTAEEEEIRGKMTITIREAVMFYSSKFGLNPDELRRKHKAFEGFFPEWVKPYPGVEETLRNIKKSGRRNHLYTNRNNVAIDYLKTYDLLKYFDGLITQENIGALKPRPDGMHKLMEQYHVEPMKMLMVGDRAVDIESAKNAGADACFFNTNKLSIPYQTDYLIYEIADLLKYL